MDTDRDTKLRELRKLVVSGEYRVDPGAVADAIVRRSWLASETTWSSTEPSIASRRSTDTRPVLTPTWEGAVTEDLAA